MPNSTPTSTTFLLIIMVLAGRLFASTHAFSSSALLQRGLLRQSLRRHPSTLRTTSSSFYQSSFRMFAAAGVGGASATKKVLVPVADGSEEIESVTIIDTLVRAGAKVTVASVMPDLQVTCSRGVKLVADRSIKECAQEEWDLIVCPGGMPGANHLRDSQPLTELLGKQNSAGKYYGAICASPAVVLQTHGLLNGRKATCYPADQFKETLEKYTSDATVVVDNNVVTSQGPGTTMAFSLRLVDLLFGVEKAKEVAGGLLVSYP